MTTCAAPWQKHLHATIIALRLGMEGMAGDRMARFIDTLEPWLAGVNQDQMQHLLPLLSEALEAQARGDFSRLADLLQYEIRPLI